MAKQIIILFLATIVLISGFLIFSEHHNQAAAPDQASVWTFLKNLFSRLNKIFELNLRPEKCVNSCGDGVCQSKLCVGKNCACPETYANCPADCGRAPTLQPQPAPTKNSDQQNATCVNKCPDGFCEEIVCLGTGCPCAETPSNCPQDCKTTTPQKAPSLK
jgi:hypothetical protein